MMENRNEHCVKNRFFGLLAKYCLTPIKKIKTDVDYLKTSFILSAIKYYESLYEVLKEESTKENKWEEFFKQFEDLFDD